MNHNLWSTLLKLFFFFNQVHLNGSQFVIHNDKTIFFFYQVHKNGPQIMIHCCNIVIYSKQLHKHGSWIVIHFYEIYDPLRIRLQVLMDHTIWSIFVNLEHWKLPSNGIVFAAKILIHTKLLETWSRRLQNNPTLTPL